ncbi:MAG: LON peptidase substrate-binding domain-containing protein [Polyangiaceae bacterium]
MSDSPSSKKWSDLRSALEAVPLFPLPEVVLYPGARLPLHVFEPRYRAMIRDVLDGTRKLAIVQLRPSAAAEEAQPPIATVAGVGEVVDATELPSGRFNILVRGLARVSLEELPFVPPYRRARATILEAPAEAVPSGEIAALISAATAFASLVRERDKKFELHLPRDTEAGTLADLCAAQLLIDGRDRQRALETLEIGARVRLVTETIALQRLAIAREQGPMN